MDQSIAEIRARIAEIGNRFDETVLAETKQLYAPLAPAAADEAHVEADIAYGEDDRQKLDLYLPRGDGPHPLVVYVPGGGFVAGDKAPYANIGRFLAAEGFACAVVNYRLAPSHVWPAGGEDVAAAAAWLTANGAAHGVDTGRIALFGQSAGATHVATFLFHPALRTGQTFAGVILASGVYRLAPDESRGNLLAYFGSDTASFPDRSPLTHVDGSRFPLMLTVAEYDPPFLATPTLELAAALCTLDGRMPRIDWQRGHNHVSTVISIGTRDDAFARGVLGFLRDCCG